MHRQTLVVLTAVTLLSSSSQADPISVQFITGAASINELTLNHYDDDDSDARTGLVGRGEFVATAFIPGTSAYLGWSPSVPSNIFLVGAQASADGQASGVWGTGWTDDGQVDYEFRWSVPYSYGRVVSIDESGPTAMATFPVVNRTFKVEAVRHIYAEEPIFGDSAHTWASSGELRAGGTGLNTTVVQDAVTVGPRAYGQDIVHRDWGTVYLERSAWDEPVECDTFRISIDPGTGEPTQYADEPLPEFAIQAHLLASSFGTNYYLGDGPFGILVGGGEALASYGLNSNLSSFTSNTWDESGIAVTALFTVDFYVTVPVEYVGSDDGVEEWRVIPEPSTIALLGFTLACVAFRRHKRG